MKFTFNLLVIFLFFSSSAQKPKTDTLSFSNKKYAFNYTSNWRVFKKGKRVIAKPKNYKATGRNPYENSVTVFPLSKKKFPEMTIEMIINHDAILATSSFESVKKSIETYNNNGYLVTICILEKSSILGNEVEINHFYEKDDLIYRVKYDALSSSYEKYLKEVNFIFESFSLKN